MCDGMPTFGEDETTDVLATIRRVRVRLTRRRTAHLEGVLDIFVRNPLGPYSTDYASSRTREYSTSGSVEAKL
jgi:hypothetical protein